MLAVLSLAILAGCGGNSPKEVAEKWHKALLDGDSKTANELSTESSHEENDKAISIITSNNEDKDVKKMAEVKFEEGNIDGRNATVYAVHPEEKEKLKIKLVKKDGKWLVDIKRSAYRPKTVDSPKEVVEKWHKALVDGDVTKANEYCTPNTQAMNCLLVAAMKENKDDKMAKEFSMLKFEEGKIDGDKATVYAVHPEKKEKQEINLVKKDGKWLVDAKK